MVLCEKCMFYSKEYNAMYQEHEDALKFAQRAKNHYCPMYIGAIPLEINPQGGDCEFFQSEDDK